MLDDNRLRIVVTPELTLDAGWWEQVVQNDEQTCLIHPPEKALFSQVVDYLSERATGHDYVSFREEDLVMTNLCLRWSSYLAILADHHKPVHPLAKDPTKSHITDEEMRRINIEASTALAFWLDLRRQDYKHYQTLLSCASEVLPMIPSRIKGLPEGGFFAGLFRMSEEYAELRQVDDETASQINLHPARAFANVLLNYSWRNGSGVENIHAGKTYSAPLSFRRIRPSDERALLSATALKLIEGLYVVDRLPKAYDWNRIALPYYSQTARFSIITPSKWTFTDESSPVRLFKTECVKN